MATHISSIDSAPVDAGKVSYNVGGGRGLIRGKVRRLTWEGGCQEVVVDNKFLSIKGQKNKVWAV